MRSCAHLPQVKDSALVALLFRSLRWHSEQRSAPDSCLSVGAPGHEQTRETPQASATQISPAPGDRQSTHTTRTQRDKNVGMCLYEARAITVYTPVLMRVLLFRILYVDPQISEVVEGI